MGEDSRLPEILRPEDSDFVRVWWWRVPPRTARVIRIAAATVPLGGAAYWFQNFIQLRGIVNLLASRIDLVLVTLCLLAAAYLVTEGISRKWKWRIVSGTVIVCAAFGLDWLAPKPQTNIAVKSIIEPKSLPPQTVPQPSVQSPNASSGKPTKPPPKQNEVPNSMTEADRTPAQKSGLDLGVSLVSPTAPAIVVDNQTDNVAEGITWELVMFRTTDQAFFSYATQNIGYVKPHSKSALYGMQLNTLPHAPGGDRLTNGENFIGTLSVDCPSCRGTTLIVSFVWGKSGWFYEVPGGNGRLMLPKDMSKGAISQFIEAINAAAKPEQRAPIL
jgi:hypothetical protein